MLWLGLGPGGVSCVVVCSGRVLATAAGIHQTEGKRIANLAELDHIPLAPHNVSSPIGTIAAHVCAAVSNFAVLEWHAIHVPHWADYVRYSRGEVITDGHIELTEAMGLGLELNEEVALEHREGGIPFFGRE